MKTILNSPLPSLLHGQNTLITNKGRMYIGRIISQDSTDIKFYRIKDGTALEMIFKKVIWSESDPKIHKTHQAKKTF
jgi:hypothetical protein